MTRCRHCLAKTNPESGNCPVCGIPPDKTNGGLTPEERKVRFHARVIRLVAMLHLIGAVFAVMVALNYPHLAVAAGVLALINLVLAFGLAAFVYWVYKLAVVYYFLIGMVNIVSVNIPGILVILLLLYAVGNGTAKALFERRLLREGI